MTEKNEKISDESTEISHGKNLEISLDNSSATFVEKIPEKLDVPLSDPGARKFPKKPAHREYNEMMEARHEISRLQNNQFHLVRCIEELLEGWGNARLSNDLAHDPNYYHRIIETVQNGGRIRLNHGNPDEH